jgi:hypothetical protein
MAGPKVLTVNEMLRLVETDRLLLPSIQRSFVWSPKQMAQLFDSLMRGYPIGTMLIWQTKPSDHPAVHFHQLHRNFDGSKDHGTPFHPNKTKALFAVLDGQQRMTALNIGVRGSLRGSVAAPERTLHIDLGYDDESAGSEGNRYLFEFSASHPSSDGAWLPINQARGVATDAAHLQAVLEANQLDVTAAHKKVLRRLVQVLNDDPVVSFQVEASNDLDRVLHVFARTNMGGTKLSYVDLLVSTATAKMRTLNPSTAFPILKHVLASLGFDITVDRIVKASLVLIGLDEPKFHVEKLLKQANMKKLEDNWDRIARALKVAALLLRSFGLTGRTLTAENVIIPVASYAYVRGLAPAYVDADHWQKDRERVRAFVSRTLLQRGYWTGAVDPVLVTAHKTIVKAGGKTFPLNEIEIALKEIKRIDVRQELLDELCNLDYGDRRSRPLLTLLFPHMAVTEGSDKDHVFPISRFGHEKLASAGVPADKRELYKYRANRLPNLQLLGAADNKYKQAKLPADWLAQLGPTARARYAKQGVKHLPKELGGFGAFWEKRRDLLREEIRELLGG